MKDGKPFKGYLYHYPSKDTLPGEVWRLCRDAPLYEVSNLGRVRNQSTSVEQRAHLVNGYHRVKLYLGGGGRKAFLISRLVASEFVSVP